MSMEKTLVILKPDCVARKLTGAVISRFEAKGLTIAAMRMEKIETSVAEVHYAEHKGKPFFQSLLDFITSGPVVVMAVEGVEAIAVVRKMLGATSGRAAEPGTIRGDYGMSKAFNLVHASDSPEAAKRELELYFGKTGYMPQASQDALRWNYEFAGGNPA